MRPSRGECQRLHFVKRRGRETLFPLPPRVTELARFANPGGECQFYATLSKSTLTEGETVFQLTSHLTKLEVSGNHGGRLRQVPWTRLSHAALWGNGLSTSLSFHQDWLEKPRRGLPRKGPGLSSGNHSGETLFQLTAAARHQQTGVATLSRAQAVRSIGSALRITVGKPSCD